MHALPLFILLFAGSTTSSGGSEADDGDDLGAESESDGYEDSGDDDPNAGPPKPKGAKGCRLAGDAGMAALLPALLLLRRRTRR